ncbi:MAG: 2-oxoacid:acceptor oxidoreductase subunit alpha [Dehalococcoidia bacterium]|nr:2-oxoacid:acceptor oxidoreductase subunit alpha [Dehalococcoidia bacterium]
MPVDVNFMVGGEAGQGVQTVGFVLAKTLARHRLHVFADQDYESRVRGGHNFYRLRAGDKETHALAEKIDVLIALDQQTIDLHQQELKAESTAIFDHDKLTLQRKGPKTLDIPLQRLAEESASDKLMANSVAIGAAIAVGGYDFEPLAQVLREHFSHLGSSSAEKNVAAAKSGYTHALQKTAEPRPVISPSAGPDRMLVNGNEAIALGAIAAGCTFLSAYPMTPATSIMEYLAGKAKDLGLVVIQPEDEIAAVHMAIGASFAGARSMTVTSGGGFCLMAEGLGLAGMTETPLVIVEAQRAGPAIGFPTRTEQGDLQFALHASHGDFPRVVLAPSTIEECFWLTIRAFNLAERYQLPVILLTDQHLASCYTTLGKFDLSRVKIERGELLSEKELVDPGEYKRYRITPSGISPRALPGGSALVVADSDAHGEDGHMIEDAETRTQMMLKHLRKIEGLRREISSPTVYGPPKADFTLVGWGSTCGAIKEAVDILRDEGISVNHLHLSEIWPFPSEAVSGMLKGSQRCFVIESNASGQMADLIRAQTGIKASGNILKFDGRPFSPGLIVDWLKKEIK